MKQNHIIFFFICIISFIGIRLYFICIKRMFYFIFVWIIRLNNFHIIFYNFFSKIIKIFYICWNNIIFFNFYLVIITKISSNIWCITLFRMFFFLLYYDSLFCHYYFLLGLLYYHFHSFYYFLFYDYCDFLFLLV